MLLAALATGLVIGCFKIVDPFEEGKTNFGRLRVGYELVTFKRNQVFPAQLALLLMLE